jgi:release factor glutamine methyltransferase
VDELTALVGGARHEARFIVDEVLGADPGGPRPSRVSAGAATAARGMATRRAAGEPLQYVFGHWSFRGLDLRVDSRVLIPRPETEQVVEVALGEARRLLGLRAGALVAVDAGTGSGAIALALASELGRGAVRRIWATDVSADALVVAAVNLSAAGPSRVGGRGPADVALVRGSWLEPLPADQRGHVDLVVSNPPYVAEEQWAGLDPEVRAEPRQALLAGPGREGVAGLAAVEAVLVQARRWLARPGAVVVELAPAQAEPAQEWARQLGYDEVRVESDLAGRPRALVARLSGSQ